MASLSANRSTVRDNNPVFRAFYPIETNVHIYQGAQVQVNNTDGYVVPAGSAYQANTSAFYAAGKAVHEYNNTGGNYNSGNTAGAVLVETEFGINYWDIGTGSDVLTQTNVGAQVYAMDDHTVGATSGGSDRAVAGRLLGVVTLQGFTGLQAKVFTIPGTP
jgi:hypothetical protein